MKNLLMTLTALLTIGLFSNNAFAQCSGSKTSTSYGAAHNSISKDIVDIAVSSDEFSTLVTAVTAAELVDALKSDGPLTVFAPTNSAFSKIPAETLASLLKPENKDQLTAVLTYHVINGAFDAEAVVKAIETGGGSATIETLNGGAITAMIVDGNVVLKDAQGNMSAITQTDIEASNGVIHVIDSVVLP